MFIDISYKTLIKRYFLKKKWDKYLIRNSSFGVHQKLHTDINFYKLSHNKCELIKIYEQHIEIFNKKALYIYIREMTGVETPVITKVTKIFILENLSTFWKFIF